MLLIIIIITIFFLTSSVNFIIDTYTCDVIFSGLSYMRTYFQLLVLLSLSLASIPRERYLIQGHFAQPALLCSHILRSSKSEEFLLW